ncbi:hypothetical protein ROHU_024419 [Labeo rohita]|uniref:Uncharacterized protein n=1 Tax=Labeo rohita TaxID=84645 RepID=A0A498MNH6_LABRO|nr:hypothetical protein ROHU_024419 [Labeo rohita]
MNRAEIRLQTRRSVLIKMSLKSRLDISEELVEQQLEMTDIHLPQCERVISIPDPINLVSDLCQRSRCSYQPIAPVPVQTEKQCARLSSYRSSGCQWTAIRYLSCRGGADERLWPRVVLINPQLGFGYRRAPAAEWIRYRS